VNGGDFCCDDTKSLKSFLTGTNDNPELFQYYYHSDHLGSSSLITNLDGEIVQHVEYVPFGEVFIEERNNVWNTPYLFNAKELDEETGLSYYEARYYDPRVSIFYGVDILVEKTGTPYQYCYQNPVKYIDWLFSTLHACTKCMGDLSWKVSFEPRTVLPSIATTFSNTPLLFSLLVHWENKRSKCRESMIPRTRLMVSCEGTPLGSRRICFRNERFSFHKVRWRPTIRRPRARQVRLK
jgi:RHS repeat-associated protein